MEVRRGEQRLWEEQGRRLKHANMRAMANFLQTNAHPPLYYRPWELRADEEELIERQKNEVETQIAEELAAAHENDPARPAAFSRTLAEELPTRNRGEPLLNGVGESVNKQPFRSSRSPDGRMPRRDGDGDPDGHVDPPGTVGESKTATPAESSSTRTSDKGELAPRPPTGHSDDYRGEELERGHEDDVIY